jgi:hypothetical protein
MFPGAGVNPAGAIPIAPHVAPADVKIAVLPEHEVEPEVPQFSYRVNIVRTIRSMRDGAGGIIPLHITQQWGNAVLDILSYSSFEQNNSHDLQILKGDFYTSRMLRLFPNLYASCAHSTPSDAWKAMLPFGSAAGSPLERIATFLDAMTDAAYVHCGDYILARFAAALFYVRWCVQKTFMPGEAGADNLFADSVTYKKKRQLVHVGDLNPTNGYYTIERVAGIAKLMALSVGENNFRATMGTQFRLYFPTLNASTLDDSMRRNFATLPGVTDTGARTCPGPKFPFHILCPAITPEYLGTAILKASSVPRAQTPEEMNFTGNNTNQICKHVTHMFVHREMDIAAIMKLGFNTQINDNHPIVIEKMNELADNHFQVQLRRVSDFCVHPTNGVDLCVVGRETFQEKTLKQLVDEDFHDYELLILPFNGKAERDKPLRVVDGYSGRSQSICRFGSQLDQTIHAFNMRNIYLQVWHDKLIGGRMRGKYDACADATDELVTACFKKMENIIQQ